MRLNITTIVILLQTFLLMLLIGLLGSCINEEIEIQNPGKDESSITFTMEIPTVGVPKLSKPSTYALSKEDENEVSGVVVLLFDTADKYSYQPIYVSGSNIRDVGQEKTFTVKVPEGTYDAVVLANNNQNLIDILSNISVGQDKAFVLNKLLLTNTQKWNATVGSTGYIPFPMWGEASITAVNGTNVNANFTLVRMLAKIDVSLTTAEAKGMFNLESVRLYNYNNQGKMVPTAANWNNSLTAVTKPSIPSTAERISTPLVYDDQAITKDAGGRGVSCINEIYTFEALAGNKSSLQNNTCLVIGGTYIGDNKTIYYRIDFANTSGVGDGASTTYLPLLRNHNYKVNITKIAGYGFATPEDAFNAGPSNIEASVLNWSDGQITEIVYDRQHMVGVSSSEFIFTREERTATSDDNVLSIITDVPTGWKVEGYYNEIGGGNINWLNLSQQTGEAGSTSNVKMVINENTTGSARTGFIHLSAGNLSFMIKVQQLAKANDVVITNTQGKPITSLEFVSKRDKAPSEQQFMVSWPQTTTLSYVNVADKNAFIFDTQPNFDEIPANGSLSNSVGEKTYTILPPAITSGDLSSDPFYERVSNIFYSIPNESSVITEKLTLRQYVPTVIPVVDNVYLMDGTTKSFGVRSNTDFTVEVKSNHNNVITLQTFGGASNTSAEGTPVYFDVIDDLINTHSNRKEVVVTIKSPTQLFNDFDVTLNCESAIIQPESNSYIVLPNGSGILIPVSRANASDLIPQPQLTTNEAFEAELVWTDNPNRISKKSNIREMRSIGDGPNGYLLVKAGSASGNAVVAIKNRNGRILWSWHIWVTQETPAVKGTHGFMDRNLGAIGNTPGTSGAKGLLYQWGRKDPFPGSDAISGGGESTLYTQSGTTTTIARTEVTVSNNFANSVENPAMYYYGTAQPYDWYTNVDNTSSRNDKLWDDGTNAKTIYDPCPDGWRMPKNGAWSGLTANNFIWNGTTKGCKKDTYGGFYPAAGCRNRSSGQFHGVGSFGYYWSSTVTGRYAYHMRFGSSIFFSSRHNNRSEGFAVRCVQE